MYPLAFSRLGEILIRLRPLKSFTFQMPPEGRTYAEMRLLANMGYLIPRHTSARKAPVSEEIMTNPTGCFLSSRVWLPQAEQPLFPTHRQLLKPHSHHLLCASFLCLQSQSWQSSHLRFILNESAPNCY